MKNANSPANPSPAMIARKMFDLCGESDSAAGVNFSGALAVKQSASFKAA
ncbi:hypothetical protein ACQX1C_09990 [Corynebacterium diphtheriae]